MRKSRSAAKTSNTNSDPEPKTALDRIESEAKFERRLFDHYEKAYCTELEVKEKLSNRTGTLLAIITLGSNLGLYFANNWPSSSWTTPLGLFFTIAYGISIVCLVAAILSLLWFFIPKLYGAHEYGYVPPPQEIDGFLKDLQTFNAANPAGVKSQPETEFQANLLQQYSTCATHNWHTNHKRSDIAYRTSRYAVWASVFFLISAIPFVILKKPFIKTPQVITLSTPVEIKLMSDEQKNNSEPVTSRVQPESEIKVVHVTLAPEAPQWPGITFLSEASQLSKEARPVEEQNDKKN